MEEIKGLPITERSNPLTRGIDTWPLTKILEVMNQEDHRVAPAVAKEIPNIVNATRLVADALSRDGRLFYAGSGTSGRIAVMDASELEPTFGFPRQRVIPLISGGPEAFFKAIEGAEDDEERGREAFLACNPAPNDVVLGIASSGRTPFVVGVLKEARARDIPTVALVGDPSGSLAEIADVVIAPDVGPEVIAGSTRLKNGTAQKLVLNMISTGAMICLGRTYSNLMAGTQQRNRKLFQRARRILMEATGRSLGEVERALEESFGDIPVALILLLSTLSPVEARQVLAKNQGSIRKAVQEAMGSNPTQHGQPAFGHGVQTGSPGNTLEPSRGPAGLAPLGEKIPPEKAQESLVMGSPEDAGLDPLYVEYAFSVVKQAVGDGEGDTPGAVAAILRHGVLVGPRAYGWAVRNPQRIPATPNTIFDMASLTKVMATLPSVLRLLDSGSFRLDDSVSLFIPEFGTKGKDKITIRHLLTHTSGLPAHIKFWEKGLRGDEIIKFISDLNLDEGSEPGRRVVYSDLGFILLGELVRRLSGQNIKDFSAENVFRPLGMEDTCFLPKEALKYRIAATEYREDTGKVMWGEVHDENAYALGGIAGHAGLFSTAFDLGRYALMWLRKGQLGDARVLSQAAVQSATTEQVNIGERRGLGWMLKSGSYSSGGDFLSHKAFGHTGFTGTSLWLDPEKDLAVILLTNRVHAGRESNAIIRLRPRFANACAAAVLD